ncbi:MAG: class I SAM-dependent methyltransferase [Mycobacteriaceae bacterium]|nr:class I SAM-dependent methyltransferase [Mycobacteriaceae bacterium]MBV9639561.1 class I SAM-dependent methyltransferase [Mycobacteriaceae bacterium]
MTRKHQSRHQGTTAPYRDLAAFDDRADRYDHGWRGRLHHEISNRTADLVIARAASPNRVLDLGCGTGYLLRVLAGHYPDAEEFMGVDAAPRMIEVANSVAHDIRLTFSFGVAEQLSCQDGVIDLIVSTTSFDHWSDQQAGLIECARILRPGGSLVLVDQFSCWFLPTRLMSRRGKARTKRRANRLLLRAGFQRPEWHNLYAAIIKAVIATKPA